MKATKEKKIYPPELQAILDEPLSKNPLFRKLQKIRKKAILSGEITRIKTREEVDAEMELEPER